MHDFESKRLNAIPTTCGAATRLACEWAQAAGIEVGPLLKQAGLTKQQVDDVDSRLGVQCQVRFLDLAASALQDEYLGFHLGQQLAEPQTFGLLYYVAASSDTLGEALRRIARYGAMVNEGVSLKYLGGKDIRIAFNNIGFARHRDRHQIECWLTLLIRLCRKLTGRRVEPKRVSLIHRRAGNASEFAAFIGCNIEFGATEDEVAFAAPIADIPVASADSYLNKPLIAKFEEAHSDRPTKRGSFRSVVENAIAPLLSHGNATESEIARRCGLSRRTLVRRLASESLTFSGVLNDLRRDLAEQYLADHALPISQIAWLLGYQEVSAFTNAFKRWTGKAPREARSQRQSSALSYPLIQNDRNERAFDTPRHTSLDGIAASCIKSLGIIAEAITKRHPAGKGQALEIVPGLSEVCAAPPACAAPPDQVLRELVTVRPGEDFNLNNWRMLMQWTPSLMWTTLPNGEADFHSPSYLKHHGVRQEDTIGWKWQQLLHPEDHAWLIECWRAVLRLGNPTSGMLYMTRTRMRTADGEYRPFVCRTFPIHDAAGNVTRWVGMNTPLGASQWRDHGNRACEIGAVGHAKRADQPLSVMSRHLPDLGDQDRYQDSGDLLVQQALDTKTPREARVQARRP